uniref:Sushi domain-containing protein n=1 Tax=Denticeps clupeoides TaxID=299321 RepID=A0AAY4AUK1_9TELE
MLRHNHILSATWILCIASVQTHAECPKPTTTVKNVVLSDEDILKASFPEGSTAKFQCIPGYSRQGSPTVTCQDGQWTPLALKCIIKVCASPGEVANGYYKLPDELVFGVHIEAVCNTGYYIIGSGVRHCTANGWDGREAVCEVVKCGSAPKIQSGTSLSEEKSEYEYGNIVTYICNNGYTLKGSNILTCREDERFHPDPPECIELANVCPKLIIENGQKTGPNPPYKLKSHLTFKCNEGFILSGSADVTCEVDGWTPLPPKCEEIQCFKPQITNGILTAEAKETYKFKSTVRFKCNPGFTMQGNEDVTCGSNADWSPLPQCKVLLTPSASPPQPPSHTWWIVVLIVVVIISLCVIYVCYRKKCSRKDYVANVVTNPEECDL